MISVLFPFDHCLLIYRLVDFLFYTSIRLTPHLHSRIIFAPFEIVLQNCRYASEPLISIAATHQEQGPFQQWNIAFAFAILAIQGEGKDRGGALSL